MTISEILDEFRATLDALSELEQQASELREKKERLRLDLIHKAEETGLSTLANDNITVSVSDKWRGKYDPEKWDAVAKWAVDNGYSFIIQRRLSDAKLVDLVESGVVLPDGLSVEAIPDLTYKRK